MSFCKYKDSLGKPNIGVHAIRDPLFNLAIIDVIMTIIGGMIISHIMDYSLTIILFLLFILGIILHRIFCVRTTVDKFLFYK